MAFYPQFREEQVMVINLIIQNLEQNPEYLDAPECPYSDSVKDLFRKFRGAAATIEDFDLFDGDDEYEVVLDKQVEKLLNDLESFGMTLGSGDTSEKIQYFKTKSVLIEKLVNLRERLMNLRELAEFRSVIIGFLEDVCDKDQVTKLMQRLDGVFGSDVRT